MDLLPEDLDKWAVFDTYDHPMSIYLKGRICVVGDAAHAAAPYHGAGAGFYIEDASVLAAFIKAVGTADSGKTGRLRAALDTYNTVRLERAQWLVESSRFVGEIYEWQDPRIGRDAEKCGREIDSRSHKIWDYDVDKMMAETAELYKRKLVA